MGQLAAVGDGSGAVSLFDPDSEIFQPTQTMALADEGDDRGVGAVSSVLDFNSDGLADDLVNSMAEAADTFGFGDAVADAVEGAKDSAMEAAEDAIDGIDAGAALDAALDAAENNALGALAEDDRKKVQRTVEEMRYNGRAAACMPGIAMEALKNRGSGGGAPAAAAPSTPDSGEMGESID